MAKLKKNNILVLKASTLLETIVASVIFLSVFTISLWTTTLLTSSTCGPGILVEVDYRLKECFRDYSSSYYTNGDYVRSFGWGNIHIDISFYQHYEDLRHIHLKAVIENDRKTISFDHIVKIDDD